MEIKTSLIYIKLIKEHDLKSETSSPTLSQVASTTQGWSLGGLSAFSDQAMSWPKHTLSEDKIHKESSQVAKRCMQTSFLLAYSQSEKLPLLLHLVP